MTLKNRIVAVGLTTLMATSPLTTPARAQMSADCVRQFERIERETQAFHRDMGEEIHTTVQKEAINASLGAMKTVLAGSPTVQAALTLREHKQKWDEWRDLANNTAAIVEEFVACLKGTSGASCDVTGFAQRHSRAYRLWFQQLLDDGLASAIDRASEAGAMVRGYINRTLNMGMDAGLNAVDRCVAQFEQSATANNSTFDSRPAPPSSAPPVAAGRESAGGALGKALLWATVIGGSAVGAAYGLEAARSAGEADGTTNGGNPGTMTPTTRATSVRACGEFSCNPPNSANARVCSGCLDVTIGSPLVPGNRYVAVTAPSGFQGSFTAGGVGTVSNISGMRTTLGSACPGPQTQVGIYREFQITVSVAAVNVALPVACR